MGGQGKVPYFKLFAEDWLSSKSVSLMNAAQEGAYIRLLCYAWQDDECGLDDNDEDLRVLSRLGDDFEHLFPRVRDMFEQKNGRLFNSRLTEEWEKVLEDRAKKVKAGEASGKARRDKKLQTRTPVPSCSNKEVTNTNTCSFLLEHNANRNEQCSCSCKCSCKCF
jgi:uncharacterized protein YdaU (DUF1376 family)